MPTATITLPRRMVDAANSYAAKESVSLVELFALLLKRQYGYSTSVVVEKQVTHPKVSISPRVHALRGVAKLNDSRPYRDIVAESVLSRYEALR